jgi:hypothetical protein
MNRIAIECVDYIGNPERNFVELRGRDQGLIEGVTRYIPQTYSTLDRTPAQGRLWCITRPRGRRR